MNCGHHADALLDLARGVALEAEARDAVRAHVDGCAACAARLLEEQHLTAGLRAIAEAAAGGAPDALEARLLEAFERQQPSVPIGTGGRSRHWRAWRSGASAAAIVLAGSLVWWRSSGGPPPGTAKHDVAESDRLRTVQTAATPAVSVAASRPASNLTNTASRRPSAGRRPRTRPQMVRPDGFVALPGAVNLPEFESGVIVRVEIALASLPSYGVPIVPDAASNPVEADILVGQDGRARAIRLVSIAAEPRSRPAEPRSRR